MTVSVGAVVDVGVCEREGEGVGMCVGIEGVFEVIGARVRHNGSQESRRGGVLLPDNTVAGTVEGTVDDEYPIKSANPAPSPLPFPTPLTLSLPFFFASPLNSPPNSSTSTGDDTAGSCLSDKRRDIARNACPDIDRPID